MGFADGYAKMGQGGRRAGGRKIGLRTQIPGSIRHGGHTGHFNGFPGPYAAHPHSGLHARATGMGMGQGQFAVPPFAGHHTRSTGYKGVGGDYAAAGPQQGFITGARGNFMPQGPGGYA